jgi:hypothetical protein
MMFFWMLALARALVRADAMQAELSLWALETLPT